jgi:hypothetical protein
MATATQQTSAVTKPLPPIKEPQTLASAEAQRLLANREYIDTLNAVSEQGLLAKGWIKNPDGTWSDPTVRGKKPYKQAYELPADNGVGVKIVERWVLPPAEWNHVLSDALQVQADRDRASQTPPLPVKTMSAVEAQAIIKAKREAAAAEVG